MKKQTGLTLIEIMISLLIGLIIISATIGIYITAIRGSTDTLRSARLNHDLDSALALMVNDIRRTGYWSGAMVGSNSANNPFTQATTDLQIPSASCVLYTYDTGFVGTGAGTGVGFVDANEYYGFKREGTNIQMRTSGNTTADCAQGQWENFNVSAGNEQIGVTNLTFTESFRCLRKRVAAVPTDLSYNTTCAEVDIAGNLATGDRVIETREITITLAGRVNQDQSITKNLTGRVKVRNDRVFTK